MVSFTESLSFDDIRNVREIVYESLPDEEWMYCCCGGRSSHHCVKVALAVHCYPSSPIPPQVNNGSYMHNEADFGGFIHKEGQGNATCSGAYVANNTGLNGGAIYAFGGANLDWQCELVNNSAVSGAAM